MVSLYHGEAATAKLQVRDRSPAKIQMRDGPAEEVFQRSRILS